MAKKLILLLSLLFGAFAFADAKDGDIQYLVVAEKNGFSTIFTTDFKNFGENGGYPPTKNGDIRSLLCA